MRSVLVTLAGLVALGLVSAATVLGIGLYNVSAHAGHLPGVSWLLHTAYRRSVEFRAPLASATPDLGDPALIALGAGHYATACVPCHGSPSRAAAATPISMVPAPPAIAEAVRDWEPRHLHWIVEEGIKMTGMPAWPASGRPDEVWSVVAYLVQVQAGTPPDLPVPEAEHPDAPPGAAYCMTCHGAINRGVPRLDIQNQEYLAEALREYRDGVRPSGIMEQAASLVPTSAYQDLAAHFARSPETRDAQGHSTPEGEILATRGTREIPSCAACHGPGSQTAQPKAPALAGQDRSFLATQLKLWRDGVRADSAKMLAAARALTDDEIMLVADWYAALPPGTDD